MKRRPLLLLAAIHCLFFSVFTGCSGSKDEVAVREERLSGTPELAVRTILDGMSEHDGSILWDALPENYQNDVNEVVQLAGEKMDGEIYDQGITVVKKALRLFNEKQELVFNTSLGTPPSEEEAAQFKEVWPALYRVVSHLIESSLGSAEGMRAFSGDSFFRESLSRVLGDIEVLTELDEFDYSLPISQYKAASVKSLSTEGGLATVEIKFPDDVMDTMELSRVSDRWVPREMADRWEAQMARARIKLEAIDPSLIDEKKAQILSVFAMVDGVLSQIELVETQEQFDQALKGALVPLIGLYMMGQGL